MSKAIIATIHPIKKGETFITEHTTMKLYIEKDGSIIMLDYDDIMELVKTLNIGKR